MRTIICFALLIISGCVSRSAVLINDQGKTVQCWANGWGYVGAPVAASRYNRCLKAAEAAGYKLPPPGTVQSVPKAETDKAAAAGDAAASVH